MGICSCEIQYYVICLELTYKISNHNHCSKKSRLNARSKRIDDRNTFCYRGYIAAIYLQCIQSQVLVVE